MSLIPSSLSTGSGRSLAAIGLDPLTPAIRRTAAGNIDFNHYLLRSHTLRMAAYAGALRAVARSVGAAISGGLAAWRSWRARRRAIDELMTLDDRTLRDLGLNRAGVLYVVDHGREDVPAPANANALAGTSPKAA